MSWEIAYGVGALVLLGALIFGMVQYQRRNRANDPVTEKATKAEYDDPATYPQKRRELQKELRP
jgi:hypothetical protein